MQEDKQILWPNILESLPKLSTIYLVFIATCIHVVLRENFLKVTGIFVCEVY